MRELETQCNAAGRAMIDVNIELKKAQRNIQRMQARIDYLTATVAERDEHIVSLLLDLAQTESDLIEARSIAKGDDPDERT